MLKLLGCAFIIVSSLSFGVSYCKNLKKRIQSLSLFIELFKVIQIKLQYAQSTIPDILFELSQSGLQDTVVCDCLKYINKGFDLNSAWSRAVDENLSSLCLNSADLDLLNKFSQQLGQTDLNGQISNLSLYIELVSNNLNEAKKIAQDKTKIALNTSIFAGLIVSILLI